MGIRETLNAKPALAIGLGAAAVALALILIVVQLKDGRGSASNQAFFTTDDGQNWFADDISNLPPYQYDGKEAVRAYVYECDGKEFVNHLERLTPEARKFAQASAEAERAGKPPPAAPITAGPAINWGRDFKKPGEKEWIPASNLAKAGPILQAKCPNGQPATPVDP